MPSLIGKQIDQVIGDALAARLKGHGYRRKGRTFHRRSEESVCVVNVQASRWNAGMLGKLTLNLGVYFPALEVPITGGASSDPPSEPECTLRQRLGGLLPEPGDRWWSVEVGSSPHVLSTEVADLWQTFGAPWLDANATLVGTLPLLARRDQLRAAVASMVLGDRAEAERLVRAYVADCPERATIARARAERWAHSVGLSV